MTDKPVFTSLDPLVSGIVKRASVFHERRRIALAELESMTDPSDVELCLEVWYRHQTSVRKGQTMKDMRYNAMAHVLADLEKRRRARLTPLIAQALVTAQMLNKDGQKDARNMVLQLVEALSGRQKDKLTGEGGD